MSSGPLSEKDRAQMNRDLRDLVRLREDLDRAISAGVPEVDQLKPRCEHCIDRIEKIKAVYFPNKA